MKAIHTKSGALILVDDADYEHLSQHCWHVTHAGCGFNRVAA